jgi:hypothetical protein
MLELFIFILGTQELAPQALPKIVLLPKAIFRGNIEKIK